MSGNWLIYEGGVGDGTTRLKKKPFCCVRKQTNYVLRNGKPKTLAYASRQGKNFIVQGSYLSRSCKVMAEDTGTVVAVVRRKGEIVRRVSFELEVFVLDVVHPGFDPGLAMVLVLVLDQMFY
ncbi:hypothetical protein SAY86_019728 [Trapa natans]|uniref:Uncharacterized protein n=1 Tax=Trapa natans TaxID=22666 RepID=A0AAN7LNM7_TRANT|nr:hypothetical protein SAY86_019728 [Trapa natans]